MSAEKTYLFITPLTPLDKMSPLRRELFHLYLKALQNQVYGNWKALVIGESDEVQGNIQFIKAPDGVVTKVHKLIFATEYIKSLAEKPQYLIRLDDDDLISKDVLNDISMLEFDCFADKEHTFFDILSGRLAQQKREWMANTVVHKFEHAISPYGTEQYPLIVYDHSLTWIEYYRNRSVVYAVPEKPVYLRILSPTSITAKEDRSASAGGGEYQAYLRKFGTWKHKKQLKGLDMYFDDLNKITKEYFNGQLPGEKRTFFQRLFR